MGTSRVPDLATSTRDPHSRDSVQNSTPDPDPGSPCQTGVDTSRVTRETGSEKSSEEKPEPKTKEAEREDLFRWAAGTLHCHQASLCPPRIGETEPTCKAGIVLLAFFPNCGDELMASNSRSKVLPNSLLRPEAPTDLGTQANEAPRGQAFGIERVLPTSPSQPGVHTLVWGRRLAQMHSAFPSERLYGHARALPPSSGSGKAASHATSSELLGL